MLAFKLSVVFAVACLLRGAQPAAYAQYPNSGYAGYGGGGIIPTTTTSDYFAVVQSTGLAGIIQALSGALATAQTSVGSIPTSWNTYQMHEDAEVMIRFATKVITLGTNLADALSSMATDMTIPIEELSDQFERTFKKLQKFSKKDYHRYIESIKKRFGCPLSHQFDRVWRDVNHEIKHMARLVAQLKEAVEDSQTRHGLEKEVATMADMVGGLASSIKKLTTAVTTLATTVASSITGLKSANTFAGQIFTSHNTTFSALNSTRAAVKAAVVTQLTNVLTKYYGAQTTIKADISTTLGKLSIFANSKQLKSLTKRFHKEYIEVYNFMRRRNRTDAVEFKKYTHEMRENTDKIMERAFHMFYDAMRRTIDRTIDIVLERGPNADSCFATYSALLPPLYAQMATLSQTCVMRETGRWAGLVTAVSDVASLIISNEVELTTNIARCATYTNYVTSSTDHAQAFACMRTSLEDMEDFTYLIEPQMDQIDKLARYQVHASKYRMENCYFSRLHELTALMKSVRISLEYCAGRHESCPRKNRHDDRHDWYDRHRGCEEDHHEDHGLGAALSLSDTATNGTTMSNATMTNSTASSGPHQSEKCKKRKHHHESSEEEDKSDEFSIEDLSKEKSVEELEDFSKEKGDKDKDKDDKDKDKDSHEKNSFENSSEEEDSHEDEKVRVKTPVVVAAPVAEAAPSTAS